MIQHSTRSTQVVRTPHAPTRIPICVSGKTIGEVIDDVFVKRIKFSKHTLRTPHAIAFDVSTLDDAERAGATIAEIHDVETGHTYTATMELIRSKGFPVRRGFGNQWALTMNYWQRNGVQSEAERQAESLAIREETKTIQQLGLWEVG